MNQCSASTSAFVWRFRRERRRAPFLAESRETRNEKRDLCPSATLLYTAVHCLHCSTLAAGSFLVILKAPSRKSLSGLFSFTLICSCKGVPASGCPRSFSSCLPLSHSRSSFYCLCLPRFFLICCKFLIKKFRFNAAIDCTFCRHHHNNLLTHLAPSAPAALHLFRLNFLVFARGVIL